MGWNTPYAARLHEHPEYRFTELDSGGKYLEEKLVRYGREYMEAVAEKIRARR